MSALLSVSQFHSFVILITFVMPGEFKLMNLIFQKIIKIEDYDLTGAQEFKNLPMAFWSWQRSEDFNAV